MEAPAPLVAEKKTQFLACMKCGKQVCLGDNINQHTKGSGQFSFPAHKRSVGTNSKECTSFFLFEKPEWMGELEGDEGKIECHHCKSKIGSWKWSGLPCSCGFWAVPAIQITKSRIDVKYR
eukprot:TRINITY_DN7777_c0_g1_i1.p1 TRINITY_DN7777_c0_g1~~TRINITY_DN7777_c0_g1_i1.p1  ORF type:complete len:133 (-),score=25.07 TRINITY_DN7777_c0_g1_i1:175-537(-)